MKIVEIIKNFHAAFMTKYQKRLLPGHRRALDSTSRCHTPESGEMVLKCPDCGKIEYLPHSCGHRNCPQCQNHETTKWLERQRKKLLPVPYFLVTFTIPSTLRPAAWKSQKTFFDAMFKASSATLKELAGNERFLSGKIGATGVLHTHNRRLDFHPHIHFLLPAGAIDVKRRFWKRKGWNFLFPEKALGKIFRGKLIAALSERKIAFPGSVKKLDWIVTCKRTGFGEKALEYLSRYLYRGIISEKGIFEFEGGKIGFSYIESKTKQQKKRILPGEDFLWLLVQHVLPKGFRRTRDFGILHGNAYKTLSLLQLLLHVKTELRPEPIRPVFHCPNCRTAMEIIACRVFRGVSEKQLSP
ncbi:MAG: transposase [Candidatus Ozemobacteraceae bacterium]